MSNTFHTLWKTIYPNTSTTVIDASGEYVSTVFQAIPNKTITKIEGYVTASSSGIVDVQLETVSNYVPSGSLVSTNTSLTGQSVSTNTYYSWTLTSSYTVPTGAATILAAVVRFNSGSATFRGRMGPSDLELPRCVENTGSVVQRPQTPGLAIGYSDGTYHPWCGSATTYNIVQYDSANTPDEYGNKFVAPYNIKVVGIMDVTRMLSGATLKLRIYDSSLNVLTTDSELTVGTDATTSTSSINPHFFPLQTPLFLKGGSTYYITRTALGTGTQDIYSYNLAWNSSALKDAWASGATLVTRSDGTGSFTETANSTENISPVIDTSFSNKIHIG